MWNKSIIQLFNYSIIQLFQNNEWQVRTRRVAPLGICCSSRYMLLISVLCCQCIYDMNGILEYWNITFQFSNFFKNWKIGILSPIFQFFQKWKIGKLENLAIFHSRSWIKPKEMCEINQLFYTSKYSIFQNNEWHIRTRMVAPLCICCSSRYMLLL